MNVLISGAGRCGTSFMAHSFFNAGYDLGGELPKSIDNPDTPIGGGMEHELAVELNNEIMERIKKRDDISALKSKMVEAYNSFPEVIKDPRFFITFDYWVKAGYRPDIFIIMMRNPNEIKESRKLCYGDKDLDWIDFYKMINTCLEHDINYRLINYPRIGLDEEYAKKVIGDLLDYKVIKEVWDNSMRHQICQ